MKNILNVDDAFNDGFKNFLMQIEYVNIQENEIEEVRNYITGHLESTVGYWTEEEVITSAKNWRLEQTLSVEPTHVEQSLPNEQPVINPDIVSEKRLKAKERISKISSLDEAKDMLLRLCDTNNEWLLDKINS